MEAVVDALEYAIRAKQRILVFGDFDVDGISATALMLRGLKSLGIDAEYLIPNRMTDGYGLTSSIIPRIIAKNPDLLVTVDCGISAAVEVRELTSQGIQVCITDHHEPSGLTPFDVPVADPKLDEDSPLSLLAGAGVALKLLAALGMRLGKPHVWRDLVDIATLGTIADIMPLVGENRSLVAEGLEQIRTVGRPGISSVLALSKGDRNTIRAIDLSYSLIPRLNAAGRMGDPDKALQLLIDDDTTQAETLALALEEANRQRREAESELLTEALEQATEVYHGQKILIVSGNDWHEGIRGIVASRLAKSYGVPAIVFSLVDGEARGSGRSIGTVNLFKAVERCSHLALRFGGHEAAVGLTVSCEKLDEFQKQIELVMEEEPDENLHPPLRADAEILLSEINIESVEELSLLEPFGQENREPLFVSCGVSMQQVRAVGTKKNHLSFTVYDGKNAVQAILFNCNDVEGYLQHQGKVDIVYRLQVDEWNGRKKPKLNVVLIDRWGVDSFPLEGVDDIDELAEKIVGEPVSLHNSQRLSLDALAKGKSVLSVMATGRGKSLIFQIHAARIALKNKKVSIFVFPLRALIADQLWHLTEGFRRLDLSVAAITGETQANEKDAIFKELYEGKVDVILTTPEFLSLHAWRFAQSERIGLIVFDEAHHIHPELLAGRTAYYEIAELRKQFPDTQYLAVTATSDDQITTDIRKALEIDEILVDDTRRENLQVRDVRNCPERDEYLSELIAEGDKTIIYINSRSQAMDLTRILRKNASQHADRIAFYHAGLNRKERQTIEKSFRAGELLTIISTSAFGEGINIPDITHVVLYHLPFNAVAYNQMSGRAGRNGKAAFIHFLYSEEDAQINEQILNPFAPSRETLVSLYRSLQHLAVLRNDAKVVDSSIEKLTQDCGREASGSTLKEATVCNGIRIFAEMGLLTYNRDEQNMRIQLAKDPQRVELSSSSLYLEGRDELVLFEEFKAWALKAPVQELREQITGPLIPTTTRQESTL
jgi:single-stranded-DNA-specific exonuclease